MIGCLSVDRFCEVGSSHGLQLCTKWWLHQAPMGIAPNPLPHRQHWLKQTHKTNTKGLAVERTCREEWGSKGGKEGRKSREVSVNRMHYMHASKELGMREGNAVGLVSVSHLLLCFLVPWGRHGCSYMCASEWLCGSQLLEWLPYLYLLIFTPYVIPSIWAWTEFQPLASNEYSETNMKKCYFHDEVRKDCDFHLARWMPFLH